MGKKKGTHDYRVEFDDSTWERTQRRWRGSERDAVLLARSCAREPTASLARVLHVDPVTKRETELARYTPDQPPPDTDDDLLLAEHERTARVDYRAMTDAELRLIEEILREAVAAAPAGDVRVLAVWRRQLVLDELHLRALIGPDARAYAEAAADRAVAEQGRRWVCSICDSEDVEETGEPIWPGGRSRLRCRAGHITHGIPHPDQRDSSH